jgi:hypothetical protein
MNIIEYARKPYPVSQKRWAVILVISLFIASFLVLFQPFGLHNLESGLKSLLLAGYGLVTCIVLLIDIYLIPSLFPALFREEHWTVLREFLLLCWIVITIAIGNYLYSVLLAIVPWTGFRGLLVFTGFTFAIAVIPITGVIVISHNALLRKNLKASMQLNQVVLEKEASRLPDTRKLLITSGNEQQKIELPATNLICLESEGNYVQTWFLEEGKVRRVLIRNTITNVTAQVGATENLFKCHRAFIINLSHIKNISGNSQGYRVLLKYLDKEVPVARNYSKSFRQAIHPKH